ncbi:thiamine phosphate synthase [Bacillus timonensis]|nr:thiamine phosphate synthase [Bacillus timonensis]
MYDVKSSLQLYFVMGSPNCLHNPKEVLTQAIQGGVTCFQFREKGKNCLKGVERFSLALELKEICRKYNVPFIVNDDIDLALELDADGVHIGQDDAPILKVREQIGTKILGVSAHNLEEARNAIEHGADYLGVGPMYETKTKADIREIQGPTIIDEIRGAGILIPIVGIGGISLGKIRPIMTAGADGIAVISAISQAKSPKKMAKELIKELQG